MDRNWKDLEEAEDFAYFRAKFMKISLESYSLEKSRSPKTYREHPLSSETGCTRTSQSLTGFPDVAARQLQHVKIPQPQLVGTTANEWVTAS